MPASYPTTPKTFTTKEAGEAFAASYVTALQDEVEAISSGLLAGTARLHSSNSTIATLSVAGGSTLAHAQVAGASTIAGTLTAARILSTSLAGNQTSFVRARLTSNFHYSTVSSWVTVPFDSRVVDVGGEWDSTTYTFTAKSSGTYLAVARFYNNLHTGWMNVAILANGTEIARASEYQIQDATELGLQTRCTINLNVGGTLQFQLNHIAGSSGVIWAGALTEAAILRVF